MSRCSIPLALNCSTISTSAARKRPVRSILLAKSRSMRSATHAGRKSRPAAPSGRVSPEPSAKASVVFHSASERRRSNSGAGAEKRSAASAAATPRGRRRLFSHASDTEEAKTGLGAPATGMNAYSTLEIVSQRKLDAAGVAAHDNLAEEGAEIGEIHGNPEIGMVQGVEELSAQRNRTALANGKPALDCEIEDRVARAGNDIAASIAESEWRRGAKSIGVEPVVGGPLAGRQRDFLSWHDIRPVHGSGV